MKHRSIGIFIILAASLAAIPQASQELAALKNAVGQRARVELWSAFLDLQSGATNAVRPAAQVTAPAAVASCEAPREASAGSTSKAATPKSDDARREVREQSRRAGESETAAMIIIDPSEGPQAVKAAFNSLGKPAVRRALRGARAGELHEGAEFAMFVPPGDGIEIDADAFGPALRQLDRDKNALLRRGEIAELEKQASFDAARERELTRRGQREVERAREDIRRRIQNGPHTKGGVEVKPVEHFLKVFKVKSNEKIGPTAPVASNARPGTQIYTPAPAVAFAPAPPAATE